MKTWFIIILSVFLVLPSISTAEIQVKKEEVKPQKKYPFEVFLSFHKSPSFTDISGFPVKARNIPVHHDDDYLDYNPCSTEPLPDTTLSRPSSSAADLCIFFTPKSILGLGAIMTIHFADKAGVDSENRYQQNQSCDAGRGYGTSLRWYEPSIGTWGQFSLAGFLATPWRHIYRSANIRLKTGGVYDLTGLKLVSRMGYDRYGSDEHWEDFTLARLHEHRVFASFELGLVVPDEKDSSKTHGTFIFQATYYHPFYDFKLSDEAPDLVWEQGGDHHWSFALGYSF